MDVSHQKTYADSDTDTTATIAVGLSALIALLALASFGVWIASMVIGWSFFGKFGQTTSKARNVFIWLMVATVGIILPPVYLVGAIGTLVVVRMPDTSFSQ